MNALSLLVAGCFFMEFLDGTIITPALPRMAVSLGTDPVNLQVGISAYLLTVAVFILPGGWAAERFGPRIVFTGAIALFTLASGLCALAFSTPSFVAARVLQGVGGAMMVPVGRLVVLRTTGKSDLLRAMALLTWPGLTAPLIGPPLGGFIAEHLHWRFIFLVNLPLGAVAILLALRLVPHIQAGSRRPFDALGFVLAGSACLCTELALDLLGDRHPPWLTAVGLLLVAVAAGAVTVRHLSRYRQPLLDLHPWSVPTFRMVMVVGTLMRTMLSAIPFLLPLLFQLGFGTDAFHAGLIVLALFAGNLGMKPMTTFVLRRFGFRTTLVANSAVQAAAMLGCATFTQTTPLLAIVPVLVLAGASRSMQFTALSTLVFVDVPQDRMAPANTWFSVSFQLSIGMGVALGAVMLRLAGTVMGGEASLGAFHLTFACLAMAMLALGASALLLSPEAGAAVSRHQRNPVSAPAGSG